MRELLEEKMDEHRSKEPTPELKPVQPPRFFRRLFKT